MLSIFIVLLIIALPIVLIGRLYTRRKSDDLAQVEYLSMWSDMTRLQKGM